MFSYGQSWISVDLGFATSQSSSKVTVGGTSTDTDGPTFTSYHFTPTYGYNINEKITIGLGIGYGADKVETDNSVGGVTDKVIDEDNLFIIMPFARYNWSVNDKFGVYGQLDITPGFGKNKNETVMGSTTVTTESDVFSLGANIRPGIYYQFSDRWSMNSHFGSLGYNTRTLSNEVSGTKSESTNSGFGLDLGMSSLGFGLNFHF